MTLVVPLAECQEMLAQAFDRVAERPVLEVVPRPVAARIVTGRMGARAIGHEFDQRRSVARPSALGSPARRGMDREEVVSVHTQARDANARPSRGERTLLAAGEPLERGDRPLIVDHVEDHRRPVHLGKQQGMMEICLCRAALADPSRGNVGLPLDCRSHRPADRLRELRCEVPRNREQPAARRVVHHRQLSALAHVRRVREQLAHHLDRRHPPGEEQALVAVRREQHVRIAQRHRRRDRHSLFAVRTYVERDASLTLGALHAIIEQARQQHVPQPAAECLGRQPGIPRSDGAPRVVEHPDEFLGERHRVAHWDVDGRARHCARLGQAHVAKIRFLARPRGNGRYMQARCGAHADQPTPNV